MRSLSFAVAALSICILAGSIRGQDTAALINQALDARVTYAWDQEPMPQVLATITEDTGVPIEVQPVVWDLLPWGRETTITTPNNLENMPLREVLRAITRPLGLTFELREEVVQVRPVPALRRLGRRASATELQLLALLARQPINLETDRPTVEQLTQAVDQRLLQHRPNGEESPFDLENRAHDVVPGDQVVFVQRNATLMAALESLVIETAATWYPFGRSVVIVPKRVHTRERLSRPITARFEGVEVGQVLSDLAQRSEVPVSIEPGALQRIPADARNIRMTLENATFLQAMEMISGFTGLGFAVRDEDVYIWHHAPVPVAAPLREPVMVVMPIPELNLEIHLAEAQLPPDIRQYIEHKKQQQFQRVREMMEEEGFDAAQDEQ